jgi:hypothetical protein
LMMFDVAHLLARYDGRDRGCCSFFFFWSRLLL